MNPGPRTAFVFLFSSLLSSSTYFLSSVRTISAIVAVACSLLALAVAANVKEIRANGGSIGVTRDRVLPVAGLNFASFFTLLAVLIAVLHGILQALPA